MHGILKLRADDPGRPDDGLARALRRRSAPRRSLAGPASAGADRGQRLPARGHRRCLTRPASSCSPRSCATRDADAVLDTLHFRGKGDAASSRPATIRAVLALLRAQGLRASWPASTASTTTPRSRASACTTSCSTWSALDRLTVKLRVPTDAPERRRRSRPTGRPPTTRSARSTTCSAWSSTATRTCAGSSCPRTTRAIPQRRDFPIGGEPVLFTYNEAHGHGLHAMSTPDVDARLPPAWRRAIDLSARAARAPRSPATDQRAADAQHRARTTRPRTGCCACSSRSRARSSATSSRSSATSTPASRRRPRTRATGRPSPSSSGWTTSPTTSTRWPSAAPSRRCSRSRSPSARSTCASSTSSSTGS